MLQSVDVPPQQVPTAREAIFTDATNYAAAASFRGINYKWKLRAPPNASSAYKEMTAIVQTAQELSNILPRNLLWYTDNKAIVAIIQQRMTRSQGIHKLLRLLMREMNNKAWTWTFIGGERNISRMLPHAQ